MPPEISEKVTEDWLRSDADAEWLDDFWQSPEGSRFLELSVELVMRSQFRLYYPGVELPSPGEPT